MSSLRDAGYTCTVIRPEDARFHAADANEPTWAETNFFGFYDAATRLNVGVYALFRPNVGIVSSTICMNRNRALTPWEADFCDMRGALPIPEPRNLLDYKLSNGLHVRCVEPNAVWEIAYDDAQGTRIDVRYESLMPAFDIHDPAMDPTVGAKPDEKSFAWGTAYNGHFDQTGHVSGVVAIRGKETRIDCVSTMDHSWGPRPERGAPNMTWLHAHFSRDFAVHGIFAFDPRANGTELVLTHGYVLERGEVFGLKSGKGKTVRSADRYADTVALELVDRTDRAWRLTAKGHTTFPWLCWPNMVSFNVLAEWACGDARGFGEIQDFFELPQLTMLNSDPETRIVVGG